MRSFKFLTYFKETKAGHLRGDITNKDDANMAT
jgi:hypothetical protein